MFKRLYFIGFLLLFLSLTFQAQDFKRTGGFSRISGMGVNLYITDPFFAVINPAWSGIYDNFIFMDLGLNTATPFSRGGSGQFLAGSFRLGQNFTLGGMLTRNDFNGVGIALVDPATNINNVITTPTQGVAATINNIVGSSVVIPLNNNVELMGTFNLGKFTLGLGVAYASTSRENTPATGDPSESSASQFGVNAGIVANLTNDLLLDAGASLILPSASFKPQTGNEAKASQTMILINARVFYNLTSKVKLVPIAAFMTATGTVDSGGTRGSGDMPSTTGFAFGVGANYTVGDFLLAGGVSFASLSVKNAAVTNNSPELKNSATLFPVWNIGFEWNLIEWFVARFGYVAITGSATTESPASATTVNKNVFTFFFPSQAGATVGVGFRFGDFSLDAIVNEDVLRQGFNNIGGGGPTFFYMSLGYALP